MGLAGGYGGAGAPTKEDVAMVFGLSAEIATPLGADANAEFVVQSVTRQVCIKHAWTFRTGARLATLHRELCG